MTFYLSQYKSSLNGFTNNWSQDIWENLQQMLDTLVSVSKKIFVEKVLSDPGHIIWGPLLHMIWLIWCLRRKIGNSDIGDIFWMLVKSEIVKTVTNIRHQHRCIRKKFDEINLKTFLMRHSLVLEQIVYTWYLRNHFHEHHAFHLHVKPPTIMDPGNWCWNIWKLYWNDSIILFLVYHVTEITLPAPGKSFCIW